MNCFAALHREDGALEILWQGVAQDVAAAAKQENHQTDQVKSTLDNRILVALCEVLIVAKGSYIVSNCDRLMYQKRHSMPGSVAGWSLPRLNLQILPAQVGQ